MKKFLPLFLVLVLVLGLTACGDGSSSETSTEDLEQEEPPVPLTEDEIKQMYSDPDAFEGRPVELVGQIFSEPEYDKDGVYFQMYADPAEYERNTIVGYENPEAELNNDDYVRVTAIVSGAYEYENMLGAKMSAPVLYAETVEVISYKDAVAPTRYIAMASETTQDQHGYAVTIEQAELADNQTRVYVTITNNGASDFTLYEFNAKLIQNSTQYETESDFDADYPEIQNDIMPGITTQGVLVFPAIENAPFQVILEAHSGDWSEKINDYVFDLTVQ